MNLTNVSDLFNYLSSLERCKVVFYKDKCDLWLPNGVLMHGEEVEIILGSDNDLLVKQNTFFYSKDEVKFDNEETIDMPSFKPKHFLDFIFNRYPDITPIGYSLQEQLSDFSYAFNEMHSMRVRMGKIKNELNELQNELYVLKRKNDFLNDELRELTEENNRKNDNIARAIIPLIKSHNIINLIQMKAICAFVSRYSATRKIFINTGFQENHVRLVYQIEKYGSADLAGIPVGYYDEIIFFNQYGEETRVRPMESGLNISIDWNELSILLKNLESIDTKYGK